ncbi:MAG: 30S ribosomal protein S4 [Candidatus Hydrogenedens sp.]|nr:30S ribosomal protein S4 [Candidatus Hydrogenedens sp.]
MGRSMKPRTKVSRRLGVFIGGSAESFERRQFPPGQHGPTARGGKMSDYGLHLREKQKLQYLYGGLRERQFRSYVTDAKRLGGNTALVLVQLLERRLDNVIFRMGLARTRLQARQLVVHCHFTLNGDKVNKPAIRVNEGDVIEIRKKSRKSPVILGNLSRAESIERPEWLELDTDNFQGKVTKIPYETELEIPVNVQYVIEYYSR